MGVIELSLGKTTVGNNATSFSTTPRYDSYTAVKVSKNSNSDPFIAGDTSSGKTLDVTCEYASQEIANNILQQVSGYSYQPLTLGSAVVEPAAEIGDGITACGTYTGIFSQDISFGRLMSSDVKAPAEDDLAHEFGYVDSNGVYATYASLANGSAAINGSGLIEKTVVGSKLQDYTVSEGKTTFSGTLSQVGTNTSNIYANAQGIQGLYQQFAVIQNGNFSQLSTSRIILGNYRLYVTSAGDCRGEYVG